MKNTNNPVRLLAEILGIVGVCEVVVMLILPLLSAQLSPVAEGLLDVSLLLLLSGPTVYWRCMAITRAAIAPRRGESTRNGGASIRFAVAMTAAAQVLGLVVTAGGVWWQQQGINHAAEVRFDRAVDRVEADVRRRLEFPVYGLTGIRGAYAASSNVTHIEFRELVQTLDIGNQFPGVHGFGFVERVPRTELARYVERQKRDGMTDFTVQAAGQLPDLYVVKHIEPLQKNFEDWGVDLGQDPVRREALERAALTGEGTLSGPITLLQNTTHGPGFLYVLPVYRNGADPTTPEQHKAALVGLLYAPLVAADVMGGVADVAQEAVQVDLYDGDARNAVSLLFSGNSQLVTLDGGVPQVEGAERMFQSRRVMHVGGRFLDLRVGSTPAFDASLDRSSAALIAVGGAFASLLMALAVWLLASGRVRAQNLARRMTAELDTMARVVQTTDNAVVITDGQLRITWVNAGFTRMSGFTLEEALGRTPGELLGNPSADPSTIARLMSAAANGEPCRVEILNRTKDGHDYWIDTDVHPTHNAKGELVSFMEVGTDITRRKHDQLELEAAQTHMTLLADRLNLAVEGGNDGLWDWMDLAQDLQWWSPSYYALLGFTPEELASTSANFLSLLHPDHVAQAAETLELALHHGKPYDHELMLRTKHQGYRWFRSRAKVFRDAHGEAIRMAGSAQDIHDRKQAEAEMRRAEALLRGSIEALDDAFALYDPEDRLVLCNQPYKDVYPLCADLMEPGNTFEQIIRAGAERGQYRAAVGRVDEWVAERIAIHRQPRSDLQQTLEDGRILRISERRMADGHTVGFRVDITDFINATQAAEAASRSKSQFLANMSHEIRTPMNAILGMLKLLQNTELTAVQNDYAIKTEGAARSLLGLLNDILDFSKVEAGKMTLDPRPFWLDTLLRDLSVILSSNVGNKEIEVLFDIDPQVPRALVGDDMRLRQVLINLGGNAIKFTSQGEVVMRLRLVERTAADVLLEFALQDSGIGIAPENQSHIFSGFSQAEASTTRRFGGTGLGLAISSRLVTLLGGVMHLDSTPGSGSTFSFQIRLGLADSNLLDAPVPTTIPKGYRTLMVDDNDIARGLVAGMAQSLGWQVDVAASGAQALALVKQNLSEGTPYAAMFVDWQMPEMDGWQTLQGVRDLVAGVVGQPLPLMVMMTAYGREMLAEKEANSRHKLDGFLVKPVTPSMLVDAVMNGKASSSSARPVPIGKGAKPKRLLGMRLLVVEDNKINQAVAQGLLSQEGAIVTLADNGRLGVDAVQTMEPAYDAVLMDLQMPVMDGMEATRVIRQELNITALPIIAMTANAMASDREACLAVGMNDHVGKPFDLDHLVSVLKQHTGFVDLQTVTPAPVVPGPAAVAEHDHPPGDLDVAGALVRVGGDATMYSTVLGAFAREMVQVPDQLHTHLQAHEQAHAVRVLHTLKGLAATVGARHLAGVAARLEHKARNGTQPYEEIAMCDTLQKAIDALADSLVPVLQQYQDAAKSEAAAEGAGGEAAPLDHVAFVRDLTSLNNMLGNFDMLALDVFALIKKTYGAPLAQPLRPLEDAMAMLDFAAAQGVCAALTQEFGVAV
jgi:PAS domain S-box-containing protein